jgi:hypothetical protein
MKVTNATFGMTDKQGRRRTVDILMMAALSEVARRRRAQQPLTGWEQDRLRAQREAELAAAGVQMLPVAAPASEAAHDAA